MTFSQSCAGISQAMLNRSILGLYVTPLRLNSTVIIVWKITLALYLKYLASSLIINTVQMHTQLRFYVSSDYGKCSDFWGINRLQLSYGYDARNQHANAHVDPCSRTSTSTHFTQSLESTSSSLFWPNQALASPVTSAAAAIGGGLLGVNRFHYCRHRASIRRRFSLLDSYTVSIIHSLKRRRPSRQMLSTVWSCHRRRLSCVTL